MWAYLRKCNVLIIKLNLLFHRDLWDYMSKVSVEMNRLTDSIKEDPDKIAIYIKTAPEKRYVLLKISYKNNIFLIVNGFVL